LSAGSYQFNIKSKLNSYLAPGYYVYRIISGEDVLNRKILII